MRSCYSMISESYNIDERTDMTMLHGGYTNVLKTVKLIHFQVISNLAISLSDELYYWFGNDSNVLTFQT